MDRPKGWTKQDIKRGYKIHGWGANSIWNKLGIHYTIRFYTIREHLKFYSRGWLLKLLYSLRLFGPHWSSPLGTSLQLTSKSQLTLLRKYFPNTSNEYKISRDVEHLLGRKVISEFHNRIYTLKGIEITHEEIYYILEDENGDTTYETALARIYPVELMKCPIV